MAVETPASASASKPATTSRNDNMIAIDAPLGKPAANSVSAKLREAEEDLARLQDQLMDVLEENQQLRMELEAWRTGVRAVAHKAS